MNEYTESYYKYYSFSFASGAEQSIDIPSEAVVKGMKIVNTLTAENTNLVSLIASSQSLANITILNQVEIPRGAILVLDEDDLGFQKNVGYLLKFKMSLAAGTIDVTLKF